MPDLPPWIEAPLDELGVGAPTRTVLLAQERLAIGLVDCVAFSTGFEFTISLRSRDDIEQSRMGFGLPPSSDGGLQISIRYPDGGLAGGRNPVGPELNEYFEAAYAGRPPAQPAGPIVGQRGGSGGSKRYDGRFWCWPLPPDGPMTVSVRWDSLGVPPTSVEVDASATRRAGLSSKKLWSE
jgi:hypothetical protein